MITIERSDRTILLTVDNRASTAQKDTGRQEITLCSERLVPPV